MKKSKKLNKYGVELQLISVWLPTEIVNCIEKDCSESIDTMTTVLKRILKSYYKIEKNEERIEL